MTDELRDEYQFDYRQAKPNRFAAALQKGGRLGFNGGPHDRFRPVQFCRRQW